MFSYHKSWLVSTLRLQKAFLLVMEQSVPKDAINVQSDEVVVLPPPKSSLRVSFFLFVYLFVFIVDVVVF